MKKTILTTEEYPPFHLIAEDDGVWQVRDCEKKGEQYEYILEFFANWELFNSYTEEDLVPIKNTPELVHFYHPHSGI